MTVPPNILVLGLGNPDRGDDGVGARVAAALAGRLPAGVQLRSRTGDMLSLIDDWSGFDSVVVVDAAAPMGHPGRIHRLDPERDALPASPGAASSHALGLPDALALARALGDAPGTMIVLAVEGAGFEAGAPLSDDVAAAVPVVAAAVAEEIAHLLAAPAKDRTHA